MIINDIEKIIVLILIISIIYAGMFQYANYSVIDVPTNIKCFFEEDHCEQNNITIPAICASIVYGIIGFNFPDNYGLAIFSSIGFQILRHSLGYGSSYIIDPLMNITAYTFGSVISSKQYKFKEKYTIISK